MPAASTADVAPVHAQTPPTSSAPGCRTRRVWFLALTLVGGGSLLLYPPAWHGAVRSCLTWQASRQGCELSIGKMEGGLFDTTLLYDIRCHQREPRPSAPSAASAGPMEDGTNFRVARCEFTLSWHVPFLERPTPSWVDSVVLEGISGQVNLSTKGLPKPSSPADNAGWRAASAFPEELLALPLNLLSGQLASLSRKAVPARFRVACDDLLLRRGRFWLRWQGGLLTGSHDEAGQFLAHEIGIGGPGYENMLADRHAQTYWKDGKLTFSNLELRPTVVLRVATLDGTHLDRRRLDWEGELVALGGTVRGQGSLDFSRRRLGLDIACSLAGVQVRPLAKTLGIAGVSGGQVVQSNFTFRGDLEDWLAGEMWMNGSVTDFRWGQRRWESLDARAIVINRHLQVHELELRQSRNHLSFNGECALPPPRQPDSAEAPLPGDWWRQAAFSCNIDARLDDLQALSNLLSPELPELQGRMSVNGTVTTRGGEAHGFEGYLNVEGSALSIRKAPLDYLRSTLIFHGDELMVADLQATHGGDYLTGKGTLKILGPFRYQAELRASAKDLAVYAPAYLGVLSPQPVSGALHLAWNGDGTPGAHSGTFHGSMERFFTSAGGVMPRPVNLEAEGAYSPTALSVRRLILSDGEGKDRHDAINVAGAVPWNQDTQQWGAGHWLDLTRPMTLRAECVDAPLDVLAALVPGVIHAARGRISGTLEANDAWRAPLLNGTLRIKGADFLWTEPSRVPVENLSAAVSIEQSVMRVDECQGTRAGEAFALLGTVDLHDTTDPDIDLIVSGRKTVRTEDGRFAARADYMLKVHGARRTGSLVSGDILLSEGYVRRRVEFAPLPLPGISDPASANLLSAFSDALPRGWLDAELDLHLTTPGSLTVDEVTAQGELAADLRLNGTWHDPRVAGSLTMRRGKIFLPRSKLNLIEGTLYFGSEHPEDPGMSIISAIPAALDGSGAGEAPSACFFGTCDQGLPASWPAVSQDKNDIFALAAEPITLLDAFALVGGQVPQTSLPDDSFLPFRAPQTLGQDRVYLQLH